MSADESAPRPILVTGFGDFLAVRGNPSGALARWVDGRSVGDRPVVGRELRVSLAELPRALASHVDELRPVALVALGVQRQLWWRLERCARRPLTSSKADVDGAVASHFDRAAAPERRATQLDVDRLARELVAAGFVARPSEDAGGYVCEWCYHHLFVHGARIGAPALFVHVPPDGAVAPLRQCEALELVLLGVARQLADAAPNGSSATGFASR